jgi:hypothetical protein
MAPMPDGPTLRGIEVDVLANTLCLQLGEEGSVELIEQVPATIDIGTGGRLVGVELPTGYVEVMEPEAGTEHLTRSASAEVAVARERGSGVPVTVTLPRRGAGYEITYPSGNQ